MSHHEIQTNGNEIDYGEDILFGSKGVFDDEQKNFIRNLQTIDLQAVPGSGKTTVLLAKLLILERHLPFKDGSGILVISHTNTAVDEIRNRIGKYCPKLFSYPSFVGTIQSFVDQFLAIPYYTQRFKKRPYRIDDEIYKEKTQNLNERFIKGFSRQEQNNAKYYLMSNNIVNTYRFDLQDNNLVILNHLNGKVLDFKKPKARTKNYQDFSSEEKGKIKKWLIEFKKEILVNDGVLHFDDAYFLAKRYLTRYTKIKTLIQRRFRYVFVDEMQDMDIHQYDLLEQLFYDDGNSTSIYQRIGDKNQAIFSGDVKLQEIWRDRISVLPLTGSCRLSPSIAKVVEPFGMPRLPIDGRNATNNDGTVNNIPPHVIVFDDNSKENVLPKFCELVKKYKEEAKIPIDHIYPIKAIAWRKGEDGKFGLQRYWPAFEPSATKMRIDYPCLKSYLVFGKKEDSQTNDLNGIHKSILNGLLKVLRVEGVANPDREKKYFTIRGLYKHLREEHPEFDEEFRMKVFCWNRDVYRGKVDDVYGDIENFVPRLLNIFGKKLCKATEFVNGEAPYIISDSADTPKNGKAKENVYQCETTGIDVQIGTVHSVKGETHTATLYLESEYYGDYESNRLKVCFQGKKHKFSEDPGKDVRKKESLRMVYVGFSRPTHLLCFAVHKGRCDEAVFESSGWEIRTVF